MTKDQTISSPYDVLTLNLTGKVSARTIRHYDLSKLKLRAYKLACKQLMWAKNIANRLLFRHRCNIGQLSILISQKTLEQF